MPQARRPLKAAFLAGTVLFASACSTLPSERAEAPPLPGAWRDAPVGADVAIDDWWKGFNDPALTALVDEALAEGPSVQLAASRLRQARGLSHATLAGVLPEVTAIGQGNYSRNVDPDAAANETMTGAWGAQVSWEVPWFSRVQAAVVGNRGNTRNALADLRGAQVALAADTAQAYVDLRAANSSRAALEESVQISAQLADILQTGFRAGFTSESDAADARRAAETARAQIPARVIETRRAENVLAVLRGKAPGTETSELQAILAQQVDVPSLALSEAPAAPADLLRLRPDVAQAEAQTLIYAAGLADARTDLLPRLNLTGALTSTDDLIGATLGDNVTNATATPLISIPLFDWGSRLAAVRQRDAQFDQALISYRQTVTQAVAEASNALVSLKQGEDRLRAARAAEAAAEITARGSRASYQAGIQSLSDRLRSEQQLIDARLTRISAEQQQASAAIAVYRAFGGGPSLFDPDALTRASRR